MDHAGVFAIGVSALRASIMSGWLTPHCRVYMPPMEAPETASNREIPNFSFTKRYCDSTISRMVKCGNVVTGWLLLLLGDVESPFPIASVAIMKYLFVSKAFPGPMRKSIR